MNGTGLYKDILENNVDFDKSFNSDLMLDNTLTDHNSALFTVAGSIQECKVNHLLCISLHSLTYLFSQFINKLLNVWKSNSPMFQEAIALKKNSPYKIFFNKGIQNMKANGEMHLYKRQNSEYTNDCSVSPEEGIPFDFLKTASIFIILSFGALLSILFLFYESFIKPKTFVNSLSEEKRNLLSKQMSAMVEKFENTDIENLRKICKVLDSTFCITTTNENS